MAYTSIRLTKVIKCDCSVYHYPHAVGSGLCKERVVERPSFVRPKRGGASALCRFIDDLENYAQSEDISSIISSIELFKREFFS